MAAPAGRGQGGSGPNPAASGRPLRLDAGAGALL